ncbi:hypothetical protein ABZT48_12735 [Streptomyces avermitilis]|uniref:hypothetical protein n=1 Tax=Streptomyces avermitilis TaxID=33903 RepID=UPI0033B525C3
MSYFMNNVMGESIDEPDEATIRSILSGLLGSDDEHFDVSLVHESGWSLSVCPDKVLLWENVEDSSVPARELPLDSWGEVMRALSKLSRGDVQAVNAFG